MFWFFLAGKKKAGLLYGAIVMLICAVLLLGVGISYLKGDANTIDINDPDCDFSDIGNRTHVVGDIDRSWGVCVVETGDNGKVNYYAVPQFDSNKHPSEFVNVVVFRAEKNDEVTLDSITDDTIDWFCNRSKAPTEKVHIDGYAQKMSDDMYEAAVKYLVSCDFTREESEELLVPYYLVNNASAKPFLLIFGVVLAVGGTVLLIVWIKKRKDIVDDDRPKVWNTIE